MKLKEWIKLCDEIGQAPNILYKNNIYRIYDSDTKRHESRIAIKKGCSDRYLAWKDTDATFKDNDNVIPVIVMRHNSYYEPLIAYRYDTKQVIWEFDRWLI